jgi:hypothetical protein
MKVVMMELKSVAKLAQSLAQDWAVHLEQNKVVQTVGKLVHCLAFCMAVQWVAKKAVLTVERLDPMWVGY